MIDIKFLSTIAERDVDLLLVEELTVNREFADWFTSRLYGRAVLSEPLGTWHSLSDSALGESDVFFLFRDEDDGRVAVLIENKIDAVAQPFQPERYRQRGEKGKQSQQWDDFRTCVVAPQQYLAAGNQTHAYDAQIAYEEVLSFFVSRRARDARFAFKAELIAEAIEKKRRGYAAEISEAMTAYVREYCELANRLAPECRVQEAKPRPAGSTWVQYRPPGLDKAVTVYHQLTAGHAKLFVAGAADDADSVLALFQPILPSEAEASVVGKSVAFSIAVPKLHPLNSTVSDERAAVESGIQAVQLLVSMYRRAQR
jgi:hypothetical protein